MVASSDWPPSYSLNDEEASDKFCRQEATDIRYDTIGRMFYRDIYHMINIYICIYTYIYVCVHKLYQASLMN